MTKWTENTKKRPCIDIKYYISKKINVFWLFFRMTLWPKVVQPYFHPKTCCRVNNNKYIPDNAVICRSSSRQTLPKEPDGNRTLCWSSSGSAWSSLSPRPPFTAIAITSSIKQLTRMKNLVETYFGALAGEGGGSAFSARVQAAKHSPRNPMATWS